MKKTIILTAYMLASLMATSQDALTSKYALIANIGQQTDGISFDVGALNIIQKTPFKPRIELGVEKSWKTKRVFILHQDLKITFVNNPYQERVYGLGSDLGFEFKILGRLLFTPRLGMHYNRAISTDVHYMYQNDKWEKVNNTFEKNNRLFVKFGLDVGYRLNRKMDVFLNGQYSANFPHFKNVVPLNLNKTLGVGVRYRLK